ncbi:FkbM family methyltransferase [Francisella philomiragia]|uniref:Methyltransferase domain protein n=1 Tax=Francisella philomiragia TaxID=28110 RepID=A0AAW3DBM1_9GAMM|nr:FkbM family methyltransferase [Francisella philomiragia]KFJ42920.1 methyltransferase domain protein [Francisella philomiragia]MBK2254142.1 FkbM family methyltransferase [Francisella philomiragia]MBK2272454.1 FkbM family methyltransferase [Francisella philomiragia]MBK2276296.1 FkbM family methyltransferase [Francisella philomiragia]MBK2280243.1 FkbM family methyltransferase [Francisella philomiragia]
MKNKIIKLISILAQPKLLKQLVSMSKSGYLYNVGWINSFKKQIPIDKDSKPLPWVTYGFIDFISDRLNENMDIFEYGSGNSTLWYGERVKSVISVEHDENWFEKIKSSMPRNVTINYQELIYGGNYSKFSSSLNIKFDIVIVDGRDRVNCVKNAINSIKENGIIVLDDSERDVYKEGIEFLLNKDFRKLDFWGISPGLFYKKNTTLFYKKNNCIGI